MNEQVSTNGGTLKVRIRSLEEIVKNLQEDVVDLKVSFGKVETKISKLEEEQHEALGSVNSLCKEIKEFKDDNARTIIANSETLGNIKGKMVAVWTLMFLIVGGLLGIAFTSIKTMMVIKDGHQIENIGELNGK